MAGRGSRKAAARPRRREPGWSAEKVAVLKRAVRLAAAGVGHDEEQDRRFDSMLGLAELRERLAALRPPR